MDTNVYNYTMVLLTLYWIALALLTLFATIFSLKFIRKNTQISSESQEKSTRFQTYSELVKMMEEAWTEDDSYDMKRLFGRKKNNKFVPKKAKQIKKIYKLLSNKEQQQINIDVRNELGSCGLVTEEDIRIFKRFSKNKLFGLFRSLDRLGLFVKNGLITINKVNDFYSARLVDVWEYLSPVIELIRKQRNHDTLYTKLEVLTYFAYGHRIKEHGLLEDIKSENSTDKTDKVPLIDYFKKKEGIIEPKRRENWEKTMEVEKGMGIYD